MYRRHVVELCEFDFHLHDEGMPNNNQSLDIGIADTFQITHDQFDGILNEGEAHQMCVINLMHCDIVIQVYLNHWERNKPIRGEGTAATRPQNQTKQLMSLAKFNQY